MDWLNGGTGSRIPLGRDRRRTTRRAGPGTSPSGRHQGGHRYSDHRDGGDPAEQERPEGVRRLYRTGRGHGRGNPTGKFLALFWSRVQDPSGTTNMDFELNQKLCDGKPPTNVPPTWSRPSRTTGDKLITYDLSKGGTVATISIRTWNGSAWGSPTVITAARTPLARGSVNTTTIPGNQAGGATNGLTIGLGQLDPRTFGEASIAFSAFFGEQHVRRSSARPTSRAVHPTRSRPP